MSLMRLVGQCIVYKIKELMESTSVGFVSSKYRIMDGYPNDLDLKTNELWPTITVDIDSMFGRDIELGSNRWPGYTFTVDVFAKTDSQRDDLSYNIWKYLDEDQFSLYNFNSAFPTSTVSVTMYNGINTLGQYAFADLTVFVVPPPAETEILGLKHHAVIDGVVYLPNL